MFLGTMVPMPKDKRQLVYVCHNFRAIAIGGTAAKLSVAAIWI